MLSHFSLFNLQNEREYVILNFILFSFHVYQMGIQEHEARAVLSKENWNIEKATEGLFS